MLRVRATSAIRAVRHVSRIAFRDGHWAAVGAVLIADLVDARRERRQGDRWRLGERKLAGLLGLAWFVPLAHVCTAEARDGEQLVAVPQLYARSVPVDGECHAILFILLAERTGRQSE